MHTGIFGDARLLARSRRHQRRDRSAGLDAFRRFGGDSTLPDISEAYAFGVPDEKYGEEICIWVRIKPGSSLTPERIQAECRGKIASYKVPRHIRIVDEFPATASGKVQRFRMREFEMARLEARA